NFSIICTSLHVMVLSDRRQTMPRGRLASGLSLGRHKYLVSRPRCLPTLFLGLPSCGQIRSGYPATTVIQPSPSSPHTPQTAPPHPHPPPARSPGRHRTRPAGRLAVPPSV